MPGPRKIQKHRWLELGLDPTRIPKRTQAHYRMSVITKMKLRTMAHFLGLDMSMTIDMAVEALLQYINQRHLANGGDESGLLRFDSAVINNDAFYVKRKNYWGGRGVLAKPRNNESTSSGSVSDGSPEDATDKT
jgi:hypothetical protein